MLAMFLDWSRYKLNGRGNVLARQTRGTTEGSEWTPVVFSTRHEKLVEGAEMVAYRELPINIERDTIGWAPVGSRIIAAGPMTEVKQGNRKSVCVPMTPNGTVGLYGVHLNEDVNDLKTLTSGLPEGACTTYTDHGFIFTALADKDTILLHGTWLRQLGERGGVLPRRQDLPPEAIWEPLELKPLVETQRVVIVGVSYCWFSSGRPDPEGKQLKILSAVMGQRLDEPRLPIDDLAVFVDFGSLFQKPRTAAEDASFGRGLPNVNLWYTHPECLVLALTQTPASIKAYHDRGWPAFEYAVASIFVAFAFFGVIAIGVG